MKNTFIKSQKWWENQLLKVMIRSAAPLPCFFDVVISLIVAGLLPEREQSPVGWGAILSIHPSVQPSIHMSNGVWGPAEGVWGPIIVVLGAARGVWGPARAMPGPASGVWVPARAIWVPARVVWGPAREVWGLVKGSDRLQQRPKGLPEGPEGQPERPKGLLEGGIDRQMYRIYFNSTRLVPLQGSY